MKIKGDFVTNSSSTSFVIGDKTGKLKRMMIEVHNDPKIVVDLFRILGHQEIEDRIDEYPDEEAEIINKIIDEGGSVYEFWASDQNGSLESGFCNQGIYLDDFVEKYRDKIEIIRGNGGY